MFKCNFYCILYDNKVFRAYNPSVVGIYQGLHQEILDKALEELLDKLSVEVEILIDKTQKRIPSCMISAEHKLTFADALCIINLTYHHRLKLAPQTEKPS
jgi:hypothetical protein